MKLDKRYEIMFVQIFYSFLLLRSADVSRTTESCSRAAGRDVADRALPLKKNFRV